MQQSVTTRRHFLTAAAAAAGAAALPMVSQAQSPAILRFQSAWSAKDIFHEYALDYARKVNNMGGGRVRIDVLPAGAVVKPQELLGAVHKGVLDGCHAIPALWSGMNSAFLLFGAAPALGMDANQVLAWMAYGGGDVLYRELYHRTLSVNIMGFLYGPMPSQPLGWFRKPVSSPAQFKGLKVRATGLSADLYRQMGAIVSEMPGEEIVAALGRGMLDGVEFNNPTSDRQLGLPGAAGTCMMQSHHRPSEAFEILFNRKKFEALPADLQAIARHAAEAASADMSWKAIRRYAADYAEMREKQQARFVKTPPEVLRAQLRAWSAVAARKARENPMFERVLESQLSWARRIGGWSLDAIAEPRMAYDHWFSGKSGAARKQASARPRVAVARSRTGQQRGDVT